LRAPTRAAVVWAAVTLAYLTPLWVFKYIPTEDGPSHLANAFIISSYHDAGAARLREYFVVTKTPAPNILYHYALAAAMRLWRPLVAEKIILSLYVLLFAAALWRVGRAFAPVTTPGALFLAFPVIYSYSFNIGFYGCMMSLAAATLGIAWLSARAGHCSGGESMAWGVFAFALYFAHVFGWAVFVVAALAIGVARILFFRNRAASAVARLLPLVPSVALCAWYALAHPGNVTFHHGLPRTLAVKLLELNALYSYFVWTRWLACGVAAALWGAVVVFIVHKVWLALRRGAGGGRVWSRADVAFAVVFVSTLAAYFFIPTTGPLGGSYAHPRLALLPIIVAAVWLATGTGILLRRVLAVLGPVVAVVFVGGVLVSYAAANRDLKTFDAGIYGVAPGSTILPIVNQYLPGRVVNVHYIAHAIGYYVVAGYTVDLLNYEARYPYFPVAWRSGAPPVVPYEGDNAEPIYDLGGRYDRVDYILTWQVSPFGVAALPHLRHYDLVCAKKELMLFKRRDG
jgi:hypothetical protein